MVCALLCLHFGAECFARMERKETGDKIILYNPQKAPNGTDGFYRLTFSDMTDKGYKWIGEWVSKDESFSYATWKIEYSRRKL